VLVLQMSDKIVGSPWTREVFYVGCSFSLPFLAVNISIIVVTATLFAK
jgi:hypothetical protein